jgi:hypothetical protein
MRTVIAATIILLCGLAAANADPYRWCAEGLNGEGTSSCYFTTLDQCRASTSGNNGGHCSLNPYYTGGGETARPLAKKRH